MTTVPAASAATAFFMETTTGRRFCLYHGPQRTCRGALLFVPPFAEEMNKSRRVAALQAREFAALGLGVLQLDLLGCGDSSGELQDASWELWKQDLAVAKQWLEQQLSVRAGLWGTRLGALLALDFAKESPTPVDTMLLWQPVLNGKSYLTQFLRLRLASDMLSETERSAGGVTTLRARLAAGETLEVAGYDITPSMAHAIDALDARKLTLPGTSVHWLEINTNADSQMPAARADVATRWINAGVDLHMHAVHCAPFWSMQEVMECPELITATKQIFAEER